jgi:inosine-uridine nucleoside N-ribohydrolase
MLAVRRYDFMDNAHGLALVLLLAAGCTNQAADPATDTTDPGVTGGSTSGAGGATTTGAGGSGGAKADAGSGGRSATGTGGTASTGGGTGTGGNASTGGSTGTGGSTNTAGGGGVSIILDTDMASDVDDVGALAILHAMADNGEATILGVICSNNGDTGTTSIPFIDIVNTYYQRPDLPVGLWKNNYDAGSKYTGPISADSATYPHDLTAAKSGVPEAAALYRKLLAAQPDGSVTIAIVGPMVTLKDLLDSPADAESSLSGLDLVAKKVKQLVVMGGGYPKSSGPEWNFYVAQRVYAAVKQVVDTWPTPIVFDGLEIGMYMMTGASLKDTPANNPVRKAYELYTGTVGGLRSSFDPSAVLYAVRGAESNWTLVTTGHNEISVAGEGSNEWLASPDSNQSYLVAKATNDAVAKEIDALLGKAPGVSSK